MPIRFRRRIKIFPGVWVNLSKGGISFTVGTKGYHLNFSDRGVKQTVSAPGTGLSHSTYLFDDDSDDDKDDDEKKKAHKRTAGKDKDTEAEDQEETRQPRATRRSTPAWVLILGIVVIYVGALVLGLIPANFLSQVLRTLLDWTRSIGL